MLLPFTISFNDTVVAQALTGDLVAAIAAKCPPGATLTVQHPADSASVLIDPAASTREKNKLFLALKGWADETQPTAPIIDVESTLIVEPEGEAAPEGEPAEIVQDAGTTAEPPPADGATAEMQTHVECNGVQHELKTPVPKKQKEPPRQRVEPGNVVIYTQTGNKYCAKVQHLLPPDAQIVCATPHEDGDYSYKCPAPDCQCKKVEGQA